MKTTLHVKNVCLLFTDYIITYDVSFSKFTAAMQHCLPDTGAADGQRTFGEDF
jgi:hypothetical protein